MGYKKYSDEFKREALVLLFHVSLFFLRVDSNWSGNAAHSRKCRQAVCLQL
jgi:hypothetical protein